MVSVWDITVLEPNKTATCCCPYWLEFTTIRVFSQSSNII